MQKSLLDLFHKARRAAVPIVAITTPDPEAVKVKLRTTYDKYPIIGWDICGGLWPVNAAGKENLAGLVPNDFSPGDIQNPTDALKFVLKLKERGIILMYNAQRYVEGSDIGSAAVAQAIWNVRDVFKEDGRTLVLLGPSIKLPAELEPDVVVLDDAYPDDAELAAIVGEQFENAKLTAPVNGTQLRAVDALRGLSSFQAEQTTAMALDKNAEEKLDIDTLWSLKRTTVEQTQGLTFWRGTETFNQVRGLKNAKKFLQGLFSGPKPPRGIVFIDEIEKAMAGSGGGDSSGVSQNQLGSLLTYMQDKNVSGILCVGPPGAGKSLLAKAAGAMGRVPTIVMDLPGMKSSLVGSSEANQRRALKVVSAITGDNALFIATCNRMSTLPPELKRRFNLCTFFFDLPDADERRDIWSLYTEQYGLPAQETPTDDGWTGAEIRNCCEIAYRLNFTLVEAAAYIVPVSRSAASEIERLRSEADGNYISASRPGYYSKGETFKTETKSRRLRDDD